MNIQNRLQIEFEFLGDEQISANTALQIINNVFKEAEAEKLILSGVSHQRELLIGALEEYNRVKWEWNKLTYDDYVNEYHPNL